MMKIAKMIEESGFYRSAYLVGPEKFSLFDAQRRSGILAEREGYAARSVSGAPAADATGH
jgi:hypothetical protein